MSLELTETLKALQLDRHLEAVTQGWKDVSEWVFCNERGCQLHHNRVRLLFFKLLKAAGVRRVRFHDLRHTFASLLLQNGESPVYVKDQMGHSSIQVTVDLYGHLIPGGNKQAVDRLDQSVEKTTAEVEKAPQAHPGRTRQEPHTIKAIESEEKSRKGVGVSARTIYEPSSPPISLYKGKPILFTTSSLIRTINLNLCWLEAFDGASSNTSLRTYPRFFNFLRERSI